MKRFYRVTGILAGIALGCGIALSLVGVSMGGTVEAAEGLVRLPGLHLDFPFVWFGSEDNRTPTTLTEEAGGRTEISWNGMGDYDYAETYTRHIERLDWEIETGSVILEMGEEFSIRAKNVEEKDFSSYVEGDTWHLEYQEEGDNVNWILEEAVNPAEESAQMVITIPEGRVLNEAKINLGAGVADFTGLEVEELKLEIGAGTARLQDLTVVEEGKLSVGMGELTLDGFDGHDISIHGGMGNVAVTGSLSGKTDIECGIGEIRMDLEASEEDYNYRVTCGIGNVEIGEESYTGVSDKKIDNGATDTIVMECGIGAIRLEFTE